jgi:hypothetical protein
MVNECDYHSETRGMVSLTDAPEDTYFGLANVSENLRPYLTIDASTGEIFLASGADVDNYSYQVTATIENNNYFENTITSGIYALEIKQINFDTSSYTISNNLADECNYSTQLTGAATFNGDLLTNTQIE